MKTVKPLIRFLTAALIIISGFMLVIVLLIQTQFSNDMLVKTIAHATRHGGTRVVIGSITGNLLSHARIDRLQIADADGVWLDAHDLQIVWRPVAWLTHQPLVEILNADRVTWARLPLETTTEHTTGPADGPSMSMTRLKQFLPDRIRVNSFEAGPAVTRGQAQILRFDTARQGDFYRVALKTLAGTPTMLDLRMALDDDRPGLTLAFREDARGLVAGVLSLPPETPLSAFVKLWTDATGVLHLDYATVSAGTFDMYADGQFNPDNQDIAGRLVVMAPDASVLNGLTRTRLAGALQVSVNVSGSVPDLHSVVKAYSPGLIVGDTTLSDTAISGSAQFDARARRLRDITGQATVTARSLLNERIATLKAHGQADKGHIAATIARAVYQHYAVSGKGTYAVDGQNLTAQFTSAPVDLKAVFPKSALDRTATLDGTARGSLTEFEAVVNGSSKTSHGQSTLNVTGTIRPAAKSIQATATGHFVHDRSVFDLKTTLSADPAQGTVDQIVATGPGLDITGQGRWDNVLKQADGSLRLNVPNLQPIGALFGMGLSGSLQMQADASHQNDRQTATVALKQMRLTLSGQDIVLQKPSILTWQRDHAALSPLNVSFAGGFINAYGQLEKERISAKLTARGLALKHFASAVSDGKADIALDLTGTAQSPILAMQASGFARTRDIPLNFQLDGRWQENHLKLRAAGTSGKASLKTRAELATRLSLLPFSVTPLDKTALRGTVTADVPLDMANPYLWPAGHRVGGVLNGQGMLSGVVTAPRLNGQFRLKDGLYDHIDTGICLRHVDATIRASNDQITLQNLTARDIGGKTLSATLRLKLAGSKPFDGAVHMNRFRLFCGGLATGDINGHLNASGTSQNMLLSGKLTLGPLNVQLPGSQSEVGIPTVKTIRVKSDGTLPSDAPVQMRLNIALDAPGQIFVRGRGLDAEFGGRLTVGGFATQPAIVGQFVSRRGKFTLLDRVLKLTKGELRFAGAIPPSPFLNIDAQTKVKATLLTIDLDGPAQKPKLTLSSQPGLPQDEILALLLFGRPLQTISPFEALKLAQATRTLAGLDGGEPGILDKARATLGLDALNIGTADDNSVTVSTGKYITDRVYVEVQQGSKPEDKQVKTEIELTPSISGNTTIDGNANQGVGLGWRYDY